MSMVRDNGRDPERGEVVVRTTDTAGEEREPEQVLVVEGYALASGCWEVWEQLEGEGKKAYEAFCAYRNAGAGRSIRGVAQTLDKSIPLIGRWSATHLWVDRVRRYELHVDRVAVRAVERQRVDMLTQHASTAGKVVALIDNWVDAQLEKIEGGSLADIPDSQISSLLRVAVMVERQSLGLPAEASAVAHEHKHRHSVDQEQLEEAVAPVANWVEKLRARAEELGIDVEGPEIVDAEAVIVIEDPEVEDGG